MNQKRKKYLRIFNFQFFLAIAVTFFCSMAQAVEGKFVPSSGKLLTIGQDVDSINSYNNSVGITPGGVVGYTGIDTLAGFTSNGDWGAGRNNMAELAVNYPDSVLVLGVAMNGQLGAINNGSLDNNINTLIDTLISYNRPIFLRWGYEADGPWNANDPGQYIQAWRKVYNMIQGRGNASNHIAMVWQVASYCGGTYNGNPFTSWYPGDQYVDWIGLSYFTPQDCNWARVNEVAQFSRDHNKPLFINESTPQRYDIEDLTYSSIGNANEGQPRTATQIWNEWFVNYFTFINSTYDDVVKAVTYINADWDSQPRWGPPYGEGYWGNGEVQDNNLIQNNWVNEVNSSQWLHASSSLFTTLGFDPNGSGGGGNGGGNGGGGNGGGGNGDSFVFGIEANGIVYHAQTGHTAGWVYICLELDCRPATLNNGRWEYQFSVNSSATYSITFKVQDNASGQCIAEAGSVAPGSGVASSVCGGEPVGGGGSGGGSGGGNGGGGSGGGSGDFVFGIDYINSGQGTLYHVQTNHTGGFIYLCLNGDCRSPTLVNGRYERRVNVSPGQSYSLEYKIQDNATGQCIATATIDYTSSGGGTNNSLCTN